jgi:hypothetical protein
MRKEEEEEKGTGRINKQDTNRPKIAIALP